MIRDDTFVVTLRMDEVVRSTPRRPQPTRGSPRDPDELD
jgi:hypothetical protein